jgi:peptidoglycan hydrolase-like protein with peptidoglycan-binding domain
MLFFSVSAAILIAADIGLSQQSSSNLSNAAPNAVTDTVSRPTLKSGSKGNEVTELQSTLKLLGFYSGMVDGVYGQTTINAVSSFQQAAGLAADGIAGPATWDKLLPSTPTVATAPSLTPAASHATASKPASAFSKPTPTAGADSKLANATGVAPKPGATKTAPINSKPASLDHSGVASAANSSAVTAAVNKPSTTEEMSAAQIARLEAAFPVLKAGMKGPAVIGLQYRLKAIGLLKSAADGVFGSETQEAVKAAQRKFNLEADGVVGPATWSELMQ